MELKHADVDPKSPLRTKEGYEFTDKIHVTVNDEEVTTRCRAANAEEGWADCYKTDAEGKQYIDKPTRKPAVERLRGTVRIWVDD